MMMWKGDKNGGVYFPISAYHSSQVVTCMSVHIQERNKGGQ